MIIKFNNMNFRKIIYLLISFVISIVIAIYIYANFIAIKENKIEITLNIKGLQSKQAYLSLIRGSKKIIIDTANINNEKIHFLFKDSLPIGLYRITIDEGNYVDLIFDNKKVDLKTDINDLVSQMEVKYSEENKQYYEYLKFSQTKNLKIFDIVAKAKELQSDTLKNRNKIDSLKKEIDLVVAEKNKFIIELSKKHPQSITSRIIKSYILPDFDEYRKITPSTPYKTKNEYLSDHFFDYINFNDTMLLNTDVFYNSCNNYIRNFTTPNSAGYKKAIDVVMYKSAVNAKVTNYFLNLFIETFEESSWEDVFTYLVDNYYLQSYCESDDPKAKDLKDKAEIIKNLAIGKNAPNILLKNNHNKDFSLYNSHNNLYLLFFWKSSCEFCEASIPKLKEIYNAYKNKGFELIAFSVDTVKSNWTDAINKNDLKWVNLSDFKGYESPIAKKYYVWRTPTFYLLDKDKKIIGKPYTIEQIETKLKNYYSFATIDKKTK